MDATDTERLRTIAQKEIEQSVEYSRIRDCAEILKLAADIDNKRAATKKIVSELEDSSRPPRRDLKSYISALTPALAILSLLITTGLALLQLRVSEREKKSDEWENDYKLVHSQPEAATGIYSRWAGDVVYETQAADLVSFALTKIEGQAEFESTFDNRFGKPVSWKTLPDVIKLDVALNDELSPLVIRAWATSAKKDKDHPNSDCGQLDDKLLVHRCSVLANDVRIITNKIAAMFPSRRPDLPLDLRNAALEYGDFEGANLSGAKISGTTFVSVELRGADLGGITDVNDSKFFSSDWWRAKKMSGILLDYLRGKGGCEGGDFAPGDAQSKKECGEAITKFNQSN
jgi:hypothetical protein